MYLVERNNNATKNSNMVFPAMAARSYSWSKVGREVEYFVVLYLKSWAGVSRCRRQAGVRQTLSPPATAQMVHLGKENISIPRFRGIGSGGLNSWQKAKTGNGSVDIPAFSKRLFHQQLLDTVLRA
jgi:hypothetical protein